MWQKSRVEIERLLSDLHIEKILKMAVAYWSEDEQCFVCDCAIFLQAVGKGETPQEARENFEIVLLDESEWVDEFAASEASQVIFGEATRQTVQELKATFDCSTDEAIDYLAHFYRRASLNDKVVDEYDPDDPDLALLASGELELITQRLDLDPGSAD